MDFFTATIAGIQLVSKTFTTIQEAIDKVSHIGEVAHHIDEFLDGYDKVQRDRFKSSSGC